MPKAPGQYRALSLQAVARGADAVLSFQWRAAATGAEKFHSGMVPHAGTDSRVWREVVSLGADLRRLAPVAGQPGARRGRARCSTGRTGGRSSSTRIRAAGLRLVDLLGEMYRPLLRAGVNADFAHPESDLSGYRLILVPALYLVSDAGADNVRRFVEDGGTALITFFSGIVDPMTGCASAATRRPGVICSACASRNWRRCRTALTVRLEGLGGGRQPVRPGRSGRTSSSYAGRLRCSPSAKAISAGKAAATRHEYGQRRGVLPWHAPGPGNSQPPGRAGVPGRGGHAVDRPARPAWRRSAAAATSS